jgi:toxin-antitoxin system PIN domain toxin
MILPDINVLTYAFRDDSPRHASSRDWLLRTIKSDARFGLSKLTLNALVRITTDHRIFATPSALTDAFGFCQDLLVQPHCHLIEPGKRHWTIFEKLCLETRMIGRTVTHACFAALAIESGCEWITFDRDYGRFPGLKWSTPA